MPKRGFRRKLVCLDGPITWLHLLRLNLHTFLCHQTQVFSFSFFFPFFIYFQFTGCFPFWVLLLFWDFYIWFGFICMWFHIILINVVDLRHGFVHASLKFDFMFISELFGCRETVGKMIESHILSSRNLQFQSFGALENWLGFSS